MLETVIVPAAVLFFLVTWMVAEEATRERLVSARPTQAPAPEPLPIVEPARARSFWFF